MIWMFLFQAEPSLSIQYAEGNSAEVPDWFQVLPDGLHTEIGKSYWLKVIIQNYPEGSYILQSGKWYMQNATIYNKELEPISQSNYIQVNIDNEEVTYFIFYPFADDKSSGISKVNLLPSDKFYELAQNKNIIQAAFQSILGFLFLITLLFYLQSQDKVYLYYGLYIFAIMIFFAYQYGILAYIFPVFKQYPPMWIWLFGFSITFFYALFTIAFFDMKSVDILAYKVMIRGIYYMWVLFCLSLTLYIFKIDVQHSFVYKFVSITIEFILIGIVVWRIIHFDGIIKNYYLAGLSILLIVSLGGQIFSYLQLVENFNYIIQAGLISEIFILTIALGVRVDQIQKKHNSASRALIEQMRINESLQKEYTHKLEEQVKERTKSLMIRSQENEVLLKEVHHRVKNNLQVIISLINMQERRLKENASKSMLTATKNKIKSIALIHEHLYRHENFASISLEAYIKNLVRNLIENLHEGTEIKLRLEIDPTPIYFETAIQCGLIINELVTNSLKYGIIHEPEPFIEVLIRNCDEHLEISVADNGHKKAANKKNKGLGQTIINAILSKNNGNSVISHTEKEYRTELILIKETTNYL